MGGMPENRHTAHFSLARGKLKTALTPMPAFNRDTVRSRDFVLITGTIA
jgi:hypothetical protein